jgi:hypothetical protein
MSDKRYVVTGHLAAFDTMTSDGPKRITFYRGQPVPEDATDAAIAHNLSVNLIAEVPGSEPVGVDAAGAAVTGDDRAGDEGGQPGEPFATANTVTEEQATERNIFAGQQAGADLDAKRAAARAKLPADGSEPDGRASQAVWVEYLVASGSRYEDVKDAPKQELQKLAEQRRS